MPSIRASHHTGGRPPPSFPPPTEAPLRPKRTEWRGKSSARTVVPRAAIAVYRSLIGTSGPRAVVCSSDVGHLCVHNFFLRAQRKAISKWNEGQREGRRGRKNYPGSSVLENQLRIQPEPSLACVAAAAAIHLSTPRLLLETIQPASAHTASIVSS
ncbi:hypothetical protein GQ53DRAFT_401643 [Thozetella sp. PMI_491]|nr:hypothetical protein GQ53DRAFT_401643 [Thozetella sp. PMI_491]